MPYRKVLSPCRHPLPRGGYVAARLARNKWMAVVGRMLCMADAPAPTYQPGTHGVGYQVDDVERNEVGAGINSPSFPRRDNTRGSGTSHDHPTAPLQHHSAWANRCLLCCRV